jgi:hypothetical protein
VLRLLSYRACCRVVRYIGTLGDVLPLSFFYPEDGGSKLKIHGATSQKPAVHIATAKSGTKCLAMELNEHESGRRFILHLCWAKWTVVI